MSRTLVKIQFNCSFEEANKKVENILFLRGFQQTTLRTGETVWKNGSGLLTAMKFIKVEYAQNEIVLSAWTQVGVGKVGGEEMDLTGIVGALPKKQLIKVIEAIKNLF